MSDHQTDDTEIHRVFRRQTHRLLTALEEKGVLTPLIRSALLRSLRYIQEDIERALTTNKGNGHGNGNGLD